MTAHTYRSSKPTEEGRAIPSGRSGALRVEPQDASQAEPPATIAGHTPGPWEAREGSVGPDYAFTVIGPKYPDGGNPVIADVCIRYDQIAGANARLIAAAPDLLAALTACRGQFDFYAREHRAAEKHEKAATNERFAFLATQAINKALGQ